MAVLNAMGPKVIPSKVQTVNDFLNPNIKT
jgi:hypothetical protein